MSTVFLDVISSTVEYCEINPKHIINQLVREKRIGIEDNPSVT